MKVVNQSQSSKINLTELLIYFSIRWYIVFAFMLAGGIIGLLLTRLYQPIYESSATFSVTIDYTRTGALTDIQEDQAMRGVGSVIFSDGVIQKTIEDLRNSSLPDMTGFDYEQAFLDRMEFRWTLRYRDMLPEKAQFIADAWAKNAQREISQDLMHAVNLDAYYTLLDELKHCYQRYPVQASAQSVCGYEDMAGLQAAIQSLSQQIQMEKDLSRGLFSHLSVALTEEAKLPVQPVLFNRNTLVFSGAVIGLFLSLCGLTTMYIRRGNQAQ